MLEAIEEQEVHTPDGDGDGERDQESWSDALQIIKERVNSSLDSP